MTQYKIKPRVKFYFFGIFSRVVYDLVRETETGEAPTISPSSWESGSISSRKVLETYPNLETAEKELKRRQNLTN